MIFVGVDWTEAHHDVHVQSKDGRFLSGGRLPEGVEGSPGFTRWWAFMPKSPTQY
jgi:hypothetical protein